MKKKSIFAGKSVEELVEEANAALREENDEKLSEEELIEEDAEYGYFQNQ